MTKYNQILSSPLLMWDVSDFGTNEELAMLMSIFVAPEKESFLDINLRPEILSKSFESYMRRMLSACATTVYMPAVQRSHWAHSQRLKSSLSPTARTRLQFIDSRSKVWQAISKYFEPIWHDSQGKDTDMKSGSLVTNIAWDLYCLALAVSHEAEVNLEPVETISYIKQLERSYNLSSESSARLSVLEGIFSLFSKNDEVPGLYFLDSQRYNIHERIDEIMEDAYLLEASALRRFFSLKAGVASIKRDLRKVLDFIVSKQKWAKGISKVASQSSFLPASSTKLAEKLSEVVPMLATAPQTSIMACPFEIPNQYQYIIVEGRRSMISRGKWSSNVQFDQSVIDLRQSIMKACENIEKLHIDGRITKRHKQLLEARLKQVLVTYSQENHDMSLIHLVKMVNSITQKISQEDVAEVLSPIMPFMNAVVEALRRPKKQQT